MGYLKTKYLLLFILGLSLALNLLGLRWGYPVMNWHPDEKVKRIVEFLASNSLNPRYFINPSFFLYLLFIPVKILTLIRPMASRADITIICRIVTAIVGTSSVFVTYLIAKKIFGEKSGIYAALFLALAAGNVIYSHYVLPAVLLTTLIMLCLYYIIKYVESGKNIYFYYSCAIFGLAMSTKYTALIVFPSILLGLFFTYKKNAKASTNSGDISPKYLSANILGILSLLAGILMLSFVFFTKNENLISALQNFLDSAKRVTFWNQHEHEYVILFIEMIKKLFLLGGVFLCLVFPLIIRITPVRNFLNRLFLRKEFPIAILVSITFFCITTPFCILDYKQFFHDLFVNWQTQYHYGGF
ncbi:MAG: glycosyltransferase family 39 protein, partial [Candidatus Omnitrophota bacterium]